MTPCCLIYFSLMCEGKVNANMQSVPVHGIVLFTVKQVIIAGHLILSISRKAQICKIKLPRSYKFYIDSDDKFSIFAKLSATIIL